MKPLSVTPTFKLFTRLFSIIYSYYPPIPRNPSSILKAGQAPRLPGATMSTLRQIEANQRNAQKSTGPTSVTGKATSSMNSLRTGIHAKSLVLPYENRAELEQLIDEYYQSFHPASPAARSFVDDLIRCEWTLRRLDNAETQTWRYQNEDRLRDPEKYPLGKSATYNPNAFSKLQYRLDATRRARDRALLPLEQLQAKTAAAPPPPTPQKPPPQTRPHPPPRPPPAPRPRRSPVPNSLPPNHFTPNWLRSADPF